MCVFVGKGVVYISMCFCVNSDHFGLVLLLSFIGFGLFQYRSKRLAGKFISEMTCFVSSGRLNLVPCHTKCDTVNAA